MALSSTTKAVIAAVIGLGMLGSGLFLYFWMPSKIERSIAEKLALNNGSESYVAWQKAPIPVMFEVNMFNVVNSADVLNGAKPIVEQMGPYAFLQYREKYEIDFDDEEDSVSFRQRKTYVFSPENSNGTLNDTITVVNVPLLAIAKQAQYIPGMQKFMLNMMLQLYKSKPFVTKTVGEMLFEGYLDPLVAALAKAQKRTILPNNTFGFFYGQNASSDGIYKILRGNRDITKFTSMVSFNNKTSLTAWNTTYCNMLNGTDGAQYPPHMTPEISPMIFTTDLCRSLYVSYSGDNVVSGIRLLRYVPPSQVLASASENPENACYCSSGNCLHSGVMNISSCKGGAPIIVSLPHFYEADERYIYGVDGLNPEKALHETYLDIEPYTGIVMNAAKRMQMNADFGPCKGIVGYEKLNPVFIPLFWVMEGATINDASADKFKSQLQMPILLGQAVTYALLGIGPFILLCAILFSLRACFVKNERESEINRTTRTAVSNDYQEAASHKLLEQNGNTVIA